MIVVVVVPIPICVPAVSFHIPPAMTVFPAIRARFREIVPRICRLLALVAVVFDRFVQFVVGLDDSFLAVVCLRARSRSKQR